MLLIEILIDQYYIWYEQYKNMFCALLVLSKTYCCLASLLISFFCQMFVIFLSSSHKFIRWAFDKIVDEDLTSYDKHLTSFYQKLVATMPNSSFWAPSLTCHDSSQNDNFLTN